MTAPLQYYARRFAKLNTDRSNPWGEETRGQAPHKAFLLLSVLDLFAEGAMGGNLIELTPELGELFDIYWSAVRPMGRDRGNVVTPFFHLRSEGFWHLQARPGHEGYVENVGTIQSATKLQETVLGAKLDEELYALLCTEDGREALRRVLLEVYFAPEVGARLLAQSYQNLEASRYGEELLRRAKKTLKEEGPVQVAQEPAEAVRDQGFRRAIVRAYEHRCALCGLRIRTADGHSAIEAAHIIPWSESQNDDVRNGLALCRLCHWTFDEGLVGVSDKYRIRLSPQLTANENAPGHLSTLGGRPLVGPADGDLRPFVDSLRWHRREVFRRR